MFFFCLEKVKINGDVSNMMETGHSKNYLMAYFYANMTLENMW